MKQILWLLLVLLCPISVSAQKGALGLSLYGGTQSYKKVNNPYNDSFSSGFGLGFQSKYGLSNRFYWAADIFIGTDDGTEVRRVVAPRVERLLAHYRRDYTLSTGIGINLISNNRLQGYLQLLGGMGSVQGYTSRYVSESVGIARDTLQRTSYIIAPGAGLNIWLSRHWGINIAYTLRYLGDVDISHSFTAGIAYTL